MSEKEITENIGKIEFLKENIQALLFGNASVPSITITALEKTLQSLRIDTCIMLEELHRGQSK